MTSEMSDEMYQAFLIEIVQDLVERTKDPEIAGAASEINRGYRHALYSILHLIDYHAEGWGLDKADVGLGDFSPDEWLREGIAYWEKKK